MGSTWTSELHGEDAMKALRSLAALALGLLIVWPLLLLAIWALKPEPRPFGKGGWR
jgi:hypothetical protein